MPARRRSVRAEPVPPVATVDDDGALLMAYEAVLTDAVLDGRRPTEADLSSVRRAGARAAEEGMSAGSAVDLYLSAAARRWSLLVPATDGRSVQVAAQTLFDGVRATMPALVEGYQQARRQLVRHEETLRREFIDDLLRGDADIAGLVQRAEPFGLDFSRAHQVVLAGSRDDRLVDERDGNVLERAVISHYGDRDVMATNKSGYLVAIVPSALNALDVDKAADRLHDALRRSASAKLWRLAAGRPYPGAYGIARSYEEAREAVIFAERLHPDVSVVRIRDLLIYRVLGRDRVAISDLVRGVLAPLTEARGGAEPLLATLEAYFATGGVATAAGRRLHLSVRAVTYRLRKIAQLTGHDPADPSQRFILQAAVLGARLLQWPATPGAPSIGREGVAGGDDPHGR